MRSTYALSTEQHHPPYSGPDYHSMLYNNASLTNYEPRNIAPRRPIFSDEETEKLPNPISTNTTASKASSFPSTMGDRIVEHINQVATSLKATQQLSSAAAHQVTSHSRSRAQHQTLQLHQLVSDCPIQRFNHLVSNPKMIDLLTRTWKRKNNQHSADHHQTYFIIVLLLQKRERRRSSLL